MSPLIVRHFGPDPATVGGIATVIRMLTENSVGGDIVDARPTWRPQSPLRSAGLAASAICTLLRMPQSHVAHIHLSEGGSFVREGALVALARRRGLVIAVTIHGASFVPFACRHPRLVSMVLRRAHFVTCLSQDALGIIRRSAPQVQSEIVPNPVSFDDSLSPANKTDELVVFAGEIGRRKGADILWRAWQLVAQRRPDARCLMVGPVTDFSPLSSERLEVRSPVDPVEMKAILQRARVVALPSRAEAMPMILTEAMSLGRPVVSTPIGGIRELAKGGGILVAVGDEIGLADRLTDLLADPELARTTGERGRRFCLETRSVEVIDARLRELYASARAEARS